MALETRELLFVYISIAIGLAGFTGLISALTGQETNPIDRWRIQGIMVNSLALVAFSVFPLLVVGWGIKSSDVWRISSAVFAVVWVIFVILGASRARQAANRPIPEIAPRFTVLILVYAALTELLAIVTAAGIELSNLAAQYAAVLSTLLVVSGVLFLRIVLLSAD